MSTQELTTIARNLKELRLMAEQLDAEIAKLEQSIKAHMEEQGIVPWHKPWTTTSPAISHTTGKPYSLLNQLLLGGRSNEHLTFQQARKEGGHVRKGEKGSIIVFFKFLESVDEDTGEVKFVPYLRHITVFHTDQCEGIAPRYRSSLPGIAGTAPVNAFAEQIITSHVRRSNVRIVHRQSNEAFYRPSTDEVVLPLRSQFSEMSEYYSTAFHELTHSTGHPSRLNRLTHTAHFGSDAYSREELCAELGASSLVNRIGLETPASFRNNAAYIAHWLLMLKDDKQLVVSAAGKSVKRGFGPFIDRGGHNHEQDLWVCALLHQREQAGRQSPDQGVGSRRCRGSHL